MGLADDIRFAFSKTAYPGDDALASCQCEECQWSVSRFRGKKWSQIGLEDLKPGEDGNVHLLTAAAFHYFMPALMLLVLSDPDNNGCVDDFIIERIMASDRGKDEDVQRATKFIRRLSPKQREVTAAYFRQLATSDWYAPEIARSAVESLIDGRVRPYSTAALEDWLEDKYGWKGRTTPRKRDAQK